MSNQAKMLNYRLASLGAWDVEREQFHALDDGEVTATYRRALYRLWQGEMINHAWGDCFMSSPNFWKFSIRVYP
jgi:hypothetical protein